MNIIFKYLTTQNILQYYTKLPKSYRIFNNQKTILLNSYFEMCWVYIENMSLISNKSENGFKCTKS